MGKLPTKKILISGANGFIGGKLLKLLKAKGIPRELLYSPELLKEFLQGFDTVIHCAAYGNHSWQKELKETFISNVMLTFNLLEASRLAGIKNFINIGSSSEYGDKTESMSEEMMPETKTIYGCTKVCGTYLTRHYSNYFNTVTVRPFSVYGEGEDERRFIPTVCRCLNKGELLHLQEGSHDWIHVDDFCRGVKKVLENISLVNGLIVNIGNGLSFSNLEIVDSLTLISGKTTDAEILPAKVNDSLTWVANNRKIKSLGWKPKISLEKGLQMVYEFTSTHTQDQ